MLNKILTVVILCDWIWEDFLFLPCTRAVILINAEVFCERNKTKGKPTDFNSL